MIDYMAEMAAKKAEKDVMGKQDDMQWKRVQKRLSGYQFFLRACLAEMKIRYPDCSIVLSAVSKLCAENWQKLSDVMKKRFQDEADLVNDANFLQRTQSGKIKRKMRVYGPKRPVSAFILFCKDWRPVAKRDNPDLTMGQISGILSEMWGNSDDETRFKYQGLSRKLRDRYQKELRVHKLARALAKKEESEREMKQEAEAKLEARQEAEAKLEARQEAEA